MGKEEEEEGEDEREEKGKQSNGGRKAATSGGCRLQARKEGRSGSFLFLRTHSIVSRKGDPSLSSTSGGNAPPRCRAAPRTTGEKPRAGAIERLVRRSFVLRATSPEGPCTDRSTLTGPRRVPERPQSDAERSRTAPNHRERRPQIKSGRAKRPRINTDPSKYTIYSIYHTAFITYPIYII